MAISTPLRSEKAEQNFPIAPYNFNPTESINSDIIAHVFGYLEGFDKDNASATCKKWNFSLGKSLNWEISATKRLAYNLFGFLMASLNKQTHKICLNDDAKKIIAELIKLVPIQPMRSINELNHAIIERFSNGFFLSNSQRINELLSDLKSLYLKEKTNMSCAELESELNDLVDSLDPKILADLNQLSAELNFDLKERFINLAKDTFFYFNPDLIDSLDEFFRDFNASSNQFFNREHYILAELIKLVPIHPMRSTNELNLAIIERFSNGFFLSNSQRINELLSDLKSLYLKEKTNMSCAELESELRNLVDSLDPKILADLNQLSAELNIDLKERFINLVKDTFFYFNPDLIDSFDESFRDFNASSNPFFNSKHCILTGLNAQLFGLFEGIERHQILDQDSELATAITPLKKHKECNKTLLSLKNLLENNELTERLDEAFSALLEGGECHIAFQIAWKIKDINKRNQVLMNIAAELLKRGINPKLAFHLIDNYLPEENLEDAMPNIINVIAALIIINEKGTALEVFRKVFRGSSEWDSARENLFMSLAKENATGIPFILESLGFSHDEINSMFDKVNAFSSAKKTIFYNQIGDGFASCFTDSENLGFSVNKKYIPLLTHVFKKIDNTRNKLFFSQLAKSDVSFPPNFLYGILYDLQPNLRLDLSEYTAIIHSTIRALIEINSIESAEEFAKIFRPDLMHEYNLASRNIKEHKMSDEDFIGHLKQLIETGKAKEAAFSLRKRFKEAYQFNDALESLLISLPDEDVTAIVSCVIEDPNITDEDISFITSCINTRESQSHIYHEIAKNFILRLFYLRNSDDSLIIQLKSSLIYFFKQSSKEGKNSIINIIAQQAQLYPSDFMLEVLSEIFAKNGLNYQNAISLLSIVQSFLKMNKVEGAKLIAEIIKSQARKVSMFNQSLKIDLKKAYEKALESIKPYELAQAN